MVSFKDFHDGEFEGIWIEGATAHVFVKTLQGERFVLTATGVAALAAVGFCAGNIILDIESTSAKDLTTRDISDVRRYRPGMEDEHASKSLRKAQEGGLTMLAINPSYGGSCLLLCAGVGVATRHAWLDRQPHQPSAGR